MWVILDKKDILHKNKDSMTESITREGTIFQCYEGFRKGKGSLEKVSFELGLEGMVELLPRNRKQSTSPKQNG